MGTIIFFGVASLIISLSVGYMVYQIIIKLLSMYKKPTLIVRVVVFSVLNTPVVWGLGVHTPMIIVTPSIIALSLYTFVDGAIMSFGFTFLSFVSTLLIVFGVMKFLSPKVPMESSSID